MKGMKPSVKAVMEEEKKAGDSHSKAKHKMEQDDEEDYKQLPKKKQKVSGKRQSVGKQPSPKSKKCSRKSEPSTYATGSLEEQWYLEILDKGRVTCPICRCVVRKTVEGLKKHMANCHQEMFTCQHCGKQLRSLAGMKYHIMADHNSLPIRKEASQLDKQSERECLRRVLKRMGKLKCTREGCTGSFTSIMGYLYHTQKCGKAAAELEKMALKCHHCNKAYRSKAGLVYHLKSEHGPVSFLHEDSRTTPLKDPSMESSSIGRIQRKSAKVAAYYLHELANEELVKEWPKRKVLQDLVPDDRKLKYTRPGMPAVSQEVLCKWRSEIKTYRRVHCPNQGCECVYGSISGLKAHLGNCTLGEFVAGKYKCLICEKEFVSESGVKYHINTVHSEDWFDNTNPTKSFEKLVKLQQKEAEQKRQRKKHVSSRSRKKKLRSATAKKSPRLGPDQNQRQGVKVSHSKMADCETRSLEEEDSLPLKYSHRRGKK
ncbi:zinc finger protein 512 [Thamnophis elegans]|uniref:zinc finger protein 512 n=1 Tax=Thamnophis elegans TaxID=35005 RepID=UPI001376E81E|nr:zinc finger protein 512 [Thamnophis elegans]